MSLYTPAHFSTQDRAAIARLMHEHAFATLVTPAAPEPMVSHLPLLLLPGCEPHGTLLGHFARANPHWQHAREVESIAIFHGPHAYISPSWYAQPERMVPTWNYASVHAHGTLEMIDDPVAAQGIIDALVQRFEGPRASPWQFKRDERERNALMGAIQTFRMRIRRLDAKFKLSQNRSRDDRSRVITALRAEGYADASSTADWMGFYANPDSGRDKSQ
jgi:transcriptional regulator